MNISDEELSRLAGMPMAVVDRTQIPFENKFAESPFPKFSRKERGARAHAFRSIIGHDHMTKKLSTYPDSMAFYGTERKKEGWSEHALALGQDIFGGCFQNLKQSPVKATGGMLIPTSPFLGAENYWKYGTGLDGITKSPKEVIAISLLHEGGHGPFYYCSIDERDLSTAYYSEVLADGFAIKKHLDRGGDKTGVQDYIRMRRLAAFFGLTSPEYWTAAACEASLRKSPIPSLTEVIDPICELQSLVAGDLCGRNKTSGARVRRKDVDYFEAFAPSIEMGSLAKILENTRLSDGIRSEGEALLGAYRHFCPDDGKEAYRLAPLARWLNNCLNKIPRIS